MKKKLFIAIITLLSIVLLLPIPLHMKDGGTVKKTDMVEYRGQTFNKADLSQETIEWLEWYNELSESEQLVISYIPHEIQKFLD